MAGSSSLSQLQPLLCLLSPGVKGLFAFLPMLVDSVGNDGTFPVFNSAGPDVDLGPSEYVN